MLSTLYRTNFERSRFQKQQNNKYISSLLYESLKRFYELKETVGYYLY